MYLFFLSLFLYNINFVSPIVYSCNCNAECGCSKTDATLNKIVGGESAVDSSWGWAVSLQKNGEHFCGGAIISPLYIITAAHCVPDPSEIIRVTRVVAGIDKLFQSTSSTSQVRSIARVFSHPNYNIASYANDIAVLQLDRPLDISYERGTARLCLPHVVSTSISNDFPVPDSALVAVGWGTLASGEISIPNDRHLQQVTLKAMSANHRMCISTINNRQIQFCAAVEGGGKDTCQGDSGGPLMHFDSNKRQWMLAGVTSYGRGCGEPNYAGVYTRVSVYRDWLRSVVKDNFIELAVDDSTTTTKRPNNGASCDLINSRKSIISLHCSFTLLLYVVTRS
ncbi:unnamed protein product [Rotaria sp. Silwood2]|nr:unnamed protein product [Rotaria sp. Silwood2]CAF3894970.1 unnamed protein product [Rotaria sp. Silwood2]